ncbi:MAG: CvpA family protein [Oscillospiraceae bacterium]|nr:CvpA family protein [Oscillospiraceae bacterium]
MKSIKNILITLVVGVVYFYFSLPAINYQNPDLYIFLLVLTAIYALLEIRSKGIFRGAMDDLSNSIPLDVVNSVVSRLIKESKIPVIIAIALVAFLFIGNVVSSPFFRANAYSNLLQVIPGDFAVEVSEIQLSSQIPMLDTDSAQRLGERKMGELADMVSQYEVAKDYTQINYKGTPVRTTSLEYGDLIKWFNNRSTGLPVYFIVDMVTQNVEVIWVSDVVEGATGIKYAPAEYLSRDLTRHLRFNYPTFMFDTPNFEIDEDGVPYWVCPRLVRRIGIFGGKDIQGAVLVNAVTGECQYYEDLPVWVDRAYSADLIIQQYDYFGRYQNGFWNSIFGQRDVTVTTEGYNYIAINDDVYMYTGITSVGTDQSNIGFILTNQRTKHTSFYSIAGATEFSAMASAQGAVQHLNYRSTFPLLLNISSQPTYFSALKDSAGLVKMYAMVNVEQYQIVATGATVTECDRNYREQLRINNLAEEVYIVTTEITGYIEEIRSAVINGNTQYYIRLSGTDYFYKLSASESEIAVVLDVGDRVSLSASDDTGTVRAASSLRLR